MVVLLKTPPNVPVNELRTQKLKVTVDGLPAVKVNVDWFINVKLPPTLFLYTCKDQSASFCGDVGDSKVRGKVATIE